MDLTNKSCLDVNNLTASSDADSLAECNPYESYQQEQSREVPSYHFGSQVTATVFFIVIFIIGVFGNLLVIIVVCVNRNMKTAVNTYLINLCVADLLVLTVCMPTVLVDVYSQDVWYFGELMCSLVPFLENTVVHASILTLIAISVERYRVVCQPLRSIRDNFYKHLKVIPVIWIICSISNIPWFYIALYKDSKHFDGTPIKVCRLPMLQRWRTVYVAALCLMYFVLPFLILLALYSRICYILQTNGEAITDDDSRYTAQCRHRRRLRAQVINIITLLILVFFVFHVPYRAISLWFTFGDKYQIYRLGIHKYFNIVYSVRILFYFNHAINPIVYNFVSSKFRNALIVMFSKRKHRESLLLSSNKRGNYQTPFSKPKNGHGNMGKDYDGKRILPQESSSNSSSSRKKMNEFYPMYANIINKHDSEKSNETNTNMINDTETVRKMNL